MASQAKENIRVYGSVKTTIEVKCRKETLQRRNCLCVSTNVCMKQRCLSMSSMPDNKKTPTLTLRVPSKPNVNELSKNEMKSIMQQEKVKRHTLAIPSNENKFIKSADAVSSNCPQFRFDFVDSKSNTKRKSTVIYEDKKTIVKKKNSGEGIMQQEKVKRHTLAIPSNENRFPKSADAVSSNCPQFRFDFVDSKCDTKRKSTVIYEDKKAILKRRNSVAAVARKPSTNCSHEIYSSTIKGSTDKENINPLTKRFSLGTTVKVRETPKLKYKSGFHQTISPLMPNPFTEINTLLSKIPVRKREPKIKKKIRNIAVDSNKYVGDIFNEEYLEDIINNVKNAERKILLQEHFLKNYNPDEQYRTSIVNWLIKIQAQIKFSESEFYLAVNLLDQVLARTVVPINIYQLLAMTVLWISNKLIGSHKIESLTLLELCNKAYIIKQLVNMEKKVLRIMNFQIHNIEPSICVNYYLKLLRIDEIDLSTLTTYYVLDCFSLSPDFSVYPLSITAAAAVNVTIHLYYCEGHERIDHFFRQHMSSEEINTRRCVESLLYSQMMRLTDEENMFTEPYHKYRFKAGGMNKSC